MKLYYTMFYLWYRSFRAIEAGYTHQTDELRAFEVAMVLSIFPFLNLLTILPAGGEVVFMTLGSVLCFINYIIFCAERKYQKIVGDFARRPPGLLMNTLAVAYFLFSVAAFVFRH